MYTYEIHFNNGEMLVGSKIAMEDKTVSLTNYTRKIDTYYKKDIDKVIEKRFFMGKVQEKVLFENKEEIEAMSNLSELDMKTLETCKKDLDQWTNKVFRIELDKANNEIKVISKRKTMKGKGFIVPMFEELKNIPNELLEKYIYSKYTTSVYLYL